MYCQSGDKPTLTYRFQGQGEKKYRSEFSPIDVITKDIPVDGTSNYRDEGFGTSFRADNCSSFECRGVLKDFEIYQPIPNQPAILYFIPCGASTWARRADGSRDFYILNRGFWDASGWVGIDRNQKCPSVNSKRCSIQVQFNGLTIFQDQGNCPVSFNVKCSNCPPGQHEVKTNTYPGFCCLDCAAIKTEIAIIKNAVRSVNRG
jgi:hypothetical protein